MNSRRLQYSLKASRDARTLQQTHGHRAMSMPDAELASAGEYLEPLLPLPALVRLQKSARHWIAPPAVGDRVPNSACRA